MLPDVNQMALIKATCLEMAADGKKLCIHDVAERLMALPGIPMHGPVHHFLVPAALLTSAHLARKGDLQALEADLEAAKERSGSIPGGICGLCGCCGAAVGTGIFASIWQKTTPLSADSWATGNAITSAALAAIASVNGPRCCKRDSFLALSAVVPLIRDRLGLDLGTIPAIQCRHFAKNRQCRGTECPFFPEKS